MADHLDTIPDTGGKVQRWKELPDGSFAPTVFAENAGTVQGGRDVDNSTATTLGGNAEFVGEWVTNDLDQIAYNVVADQAGTLYIEISPDGGETITYTRTVPLRADEPKFGSFVKGPGRSHRTRFVNGAVAQSSFVLWVGTGSALFPSSVSADGELYTTVTERERDVFTNHGVLNLSATIYAILVDKSDTVNWPHDETGRIDISALYVAVYRDSTATGAIRVGVITAVSGSSASVAWAMGLRFDKSNEQHIVRDRHWTPSQLKCAVVDGATPHMLVTTETGISAINTATPLASPRGAATVTPAVGDIIIHYERGAGTYNASVACFYHGEVNAT
jgi:hypothetical protein